MNSLEKPIVKPFVNPIKTPIVKLSISYSPYQLPWPEGLARKHQNEGTLLKVETEWGLGYADLHPWPTLGDPPWKEQLRTLSQLPLNDIIWEKEQWSDCPREMTSIHPQLQRSLTMARADAFARHQHQRGPQGHPALLNHFLFLEETLSLETLKSQGINPHDGAFAKWKITPASFKSNLEFILKAAQDFPLLRWRLDANALFDFEPLLNQWKDLSQEERTLIDFIEDPCPYHENHWRALAEAGMPLAMDFEIKTWLKGRSLKEVSRPLSPHQITLVLKPAIQDLQEWGDWLIENPSGVVLTSNLDHPIGLLHGLWQAEIFARHAFVQNQPERLKCCGFNLALLPQTLKEMGFQISQSTFNDMNQNHDDNDNRRVWRGFEGFGVGNSQFLEGLPWIPLTTI